MLKRSSPRIVALPETPLHVTTAFRMMHATRLQLIGVRTSRRSHGWRAGSHKVNYSPSSESPLVLRDASLSFVPLSHDIRLLEQCFLCRAFSGDMYLNSVAATVSPFHLA